MKLFSLVVWMAWAAIVVRILLAPYWAVSVGEAMFLLLVVAPAIAVLFVAVRWLMNRAEEPHPKMS